MSTDLLCVLITVGGDEEIKHADTMHIKRMLLIFQQHESRRTLGKVANSDSLAKAKDCSNAR